MIRDDRPGYWRRTCRLMAAALVVWLAAGLGLNLLAGDLGERIVFGYPAGFLLAALGSPVLLVGLAFWFADRQDRLDRDYGMAEED
jgi:putative solute:sodium symporter small subunit